MAIEPLPPDYAGAVTYQELLALARSNEGRTLQTPTGKRFTVGIYLDCPFFTPKEIEVSCN